MPVSSWLLILERLKKSCNIFNSWPRLLYNDFEMFLI